MEAVTMKKTEFKTLIDSLLDLYNDYKALYETFGDESYRNVMDLCLDKLKEVVELRKGQTA